MVVAKVAPKSIVSLIKAGDTSRAVRAAIIIQRIPTTENDKDVSFIIHLPFAASGIPRFILPPDSDIIYGMRDSSIKLPKCQ
jgi:hypothetical protein